MKRILLGAVLCIALNNYAMTPDETSNDLSSVGAHSTPRSLSPISSLEEFKSQCKEESEIGKLFIGNIRSPIMSSTEFLAMLEEVAKFDCAEHIDAKSEPKFRESTPSEIVILDTILPNAINLSDFTTGQKITLFNTILSVHVQNRNLEKIAELLQTLENDPQCDPTDIIDEETIQEASLLRKKTKNLLPMHSKEDYARSREIHKKLYKYSDFIDDSFSSDSESEDEDSEHNPDQHSPRRHPFDMPNRGWRPWEPRTPSPKFYVESVLRANGLEFDSVAKELSQLFESQMDDNTMVLGSLFD